MLNRSSLCLSPSLVHQGEGDGGCQGRGGRAGVRQGQPDRHELRRGSEQPPQQSLSGTALTLLLGFGACERNQPFNTRLSHELAGYAAFLVGGK